MGRSRFATIDCETDPFLYGRVPKPFVWGFYDGKQFDYFTHTDAVAEKLSNFKGAVYAHNGGKFDYHFLIPHIQQKSRIMVINGRLSRFKIGQATCYDSFNLLPMALKKLKKDSFDYNLLEKEHRSEHWQEIITYLQHDCEYLHQYLDDFFTRYSRAITAASAGMRQWVKMRNQPPPRSNQEYYAKFRPFYFGGRVQAIKPGLFTGRFNMLDINSAYPYAMTHRHPMGTKHFVTKEPKDSELEHSMLTVKCFSDGALPIRGKENTIEFPSRHDTYHVTGWEFITALELGKISDIEILECFVFTELEDFKPYIDKFFLEKQNCDKAGDHAGRTFAKLLMNSLYGKFAANPENYREYMIAEFGDQIEGYNPDSILGEHQLFSKPIPVEQHRYYNLATAASITGFVRAYLFKSLQQVDTPFYCDTDSIICKSHRDLTLSDGLGGWKLEANAHKLAIAGKKLYAAWLDKGTKVACKGVRINASQIEKICKGATITYLSEAPTFSLKRGIKFLERKVKKTVDSPDSDMVAYG